MPLAADAVRVELTIDGGFAYIPGLAGPIVVDGAQVAAAEAGELRRLCRAALAVTTSAAGTKRAATPDARRYQLTIVIDDKKHELVAADPVNPPAVAALIAFVRQHGVARNP